MRVAPPGGTWAGAAMPTRNPRAPSVSPNDTNTSPRRIAAPRERAAATGSGPGGASSAT